MVIRGGRTTGCKYFISGPFNPVTYSSESSLHRLLHQLVPYLPFLQAIWCVIVDPFHHAIFPNTPAFLIFVLVLTSTAAQEGDRWAV